MYVLCCLYITFKVEIWFLCLLGVSSSIYYTSGTVCCWNCCIRLPSCFIWNCFILQCQYSVLILQYSTLFLKLMLYLNFLGRLYGKYHENINPFEYNRVKDIWFFNRKRKVISIWNLVIDIDIASDIALADFREWLRGFQSPLWSENFTKK